MEKSQQIHKKHKIEPILELKRNIFKAKNAPRGPVTNQKQPRGPVSLKTDF